MAKIIIPTPLRKFTGNKASFDAQGTTVQQAVLDLVNTHTGLAQHILDDKQNIRSFIRIYVGEDDINDTGGVETVVAETSIISIVPAIAGGSQ